MSESKATLRIDGRAPPALQIVAQDKYSFPVGEMTGFRLEASGGFAPYTWLIEDPLPEWVNISSGVITGQPMNMSLIGLSRISVSLTDGGGEVAGPQLVSLSVIRNPEINLPSIPEIELPVASLGEPYKAALSARGGKSPYLFTKVRTQQIPWLQVSENGNIYGTPTEIGDEEITIKMTDQIGQKSRPVTFILPVRNIQTSSPLQVRLTSPPVAVVGERYEYFIPVTGGIPPYIFKSTVLENTANGLSFNNETGSITGVPANPENSSFQIIVQDQAIPLTAIKRTLKVRAIAIIKPLEPPSGVSPEQTLLISALVLIVVIVSAVFGVIMFRVRL